MPVRPLLLSLALLLAAPGAALAETTTIVDPGATGSCARGATCKTVQAAVGVSQASDTVRVKAGTYAENVTADVAQLTLAGDPGAFVTGAATGTPLTVSAAGVTVDGLGVFKPTGTDLALSATGGGLKLTDAVVASFGGPAMRVTAGTGNVVQRSTIVAAGDALHLSVTGTGERRLAVDSSILASTGARAVRVTTAMASGAGFLTLNHVTATAGGIALEGGSGALAPGDITAAINASIVRGPSTAAGFAGTPSVIPGAPPLVAPNAVTATYVRSDATAMTVTGGATSSGSGTVTPDDRLFADKSRLKPAAPVIDQGGPLIDGESATDIDGDARVIGPASDIGADEYLNKAPALTFALSATSVKTGAAVTATGTATDPDGASDIATYGVDWGDGTKQSSSSPQLSHAYAKPGTYQVVMAVADKQGAIAAAPAQTVTVTEAARAQVRITSPKAGASPKLAGTKPRSLTITGTLAGAGGVEVALTRRAGGCAHYDGTRFTKGACNAPVYLPATLTGSGFKLSTVKLRFKKGGHEVRVRPTGGAGKAARVTFKVR